MTLTEEERHRFAEYCRITARSNRRLVEQMTKIPGPAVVVMEEKYRREAEALDTVADMLERTETMTLGGG